MTQEGKAVRLTKEVETDSTVNLPTVSASVPATKMERRGAKNKSLTYFHDECLFFCAWVNVRALRIGCHAGKARAFDRVAL